MPHEKKIGKPYCRLPVLKGELLSRKKKERQQP